MKLLDKLKDLFIDEIEVDETEVVKTKKEPKVKKKEDKVMTEKKPVQSPKIDNSSISAGVGEFFDLKKETNPQNDVREVPFKVPNVMEEERKKENNDFMFEKFENKIEDNTIKEYKEMVPKTRTELHKKDIMSFENPYAKEEEVKINKEVLPKKKEEPLKVADLYKDPEGEKKSTTFTSKKKTTGKEMFRASPVISPIYGVLDKNYKKEEVLSRNESSYEIQRLSKKIDFDTVRRKAFGNLSDDIKNNLCEDCELLKEVKKLEKIKETELLYEMMDDDIVDTNGPSLEDAYDNFSDLGVSYEKIDDKVVVSGDEIVLNHDEEIIINNSNDTETVAEEIDIQSDLDEIIKPSKKTRTKTKEEYAAEEISEDNNDRLEEDLFDLIDSMYEEREEG